MLVFKNDISMYKFNVMDNTIAPLHDSFWNDNCIYRVLDTCMILHVTLMELLQVTPSYIPTITCTIICNWLTMVAYGWLF